jgi:hypothetical protein
MQGSFFDILFENIKVCLFFLIIHFVVIVFYTR